MLERRLGVGLFKEGDGPPVEDMAESAILFTALPPNGGQVGVGEGGQVELEGEDRLGLEPLSLRRKGSDLLLQLGLRPGDTALLLLVWEEFFLLKTRFFYLQVFNFTRQFSPAQDGSPQALHGCRVHLLDVQQLLQGLQLRS